MSRQKGKGRKRKRSWHRTGREDRHWLRALKTLRRAEKSASVSPSWNRGSE